MSIEFEIGGQYYQAVAIPPRRAIHVMRRMGPAFVTTLQEIFNGFGSVPAALESLGAIMQEGMNDDLLKKILNTLPTAAHAIAEMSDADADFVIDACLHVTQRRNAGGSGWSKIIAANGVMMFQDTNIRTLLEISYKVLELTFKDFSSAGPSSSQEQA